MGFLRKWWKQPSTKLGFAKILGGLVAYKSGLDPDAMLGLPVQRLIEFGAVVFTLAIYASLIYATFPKDDKPR